MKVHVDGVEGGREHLGQFECGHDCHMNEGGSWGILQHVLQKSSLLKMLTPFRTISDCLQSSPVKFLK